MAAAGPPLDPVPSPTEPPSLVRATAIMTAGTTLSRVTGFARLAVMAWAMGATESKLPDTYYLANTMPNIVYQLVLGEVLATIFIPVFVESLASRTREAAWRLASTVLHLALIMAAAFSAVAIVAAPWLIKIYTFRIEDPAVRAAQEEVGTFLLRLLLPQMIFYAAGAVLTGLLNAHRRFAAPMFAPVLNNLVVIATFVAFRAMHGHDTPTLASLSSSDKLLLGLGTTAGVVAMTAALWPAVRRLPGRRPLRELDWREPAIRHVGRLARYSLGYVIVNQIGLWVVKALANGTVGGVAAFDISFVLYQLPYGIFAVSVMTALVPSLAEHHVRRDHVAFRRDLSLGLRTTAFIVLPAAAGFIALSRPIVRLLLERGVFGASSTDLLADTLALMALGLGAYAAFQQLMRAFYAMQDTWTPWRVNIVAVAFNVATAIPLYQALGVPGLALSHALAYFVAAVGGAALLRKRIGGIDGRRLAASLSKVLVASVATGLGAWGAARGVASPGAGLAGQLVEAAAGIGAGLGIYAAAAVALRLEEARPLLRLVLPRGTRPRSPGPER